MKLQEEDYPDLLTKINGHFLVFGESQFLPGYLILIHKNSKPKRLSDLEVNEQIEFMLIVTCIQATLSAYLEDLQVDFARCNVEILGNKDHYVHAHFWPRYSWELNHLAQESVRSYKKSEIESMERNLKDNSRGINKERFQSEFLEKLEKMYADFTKYFDEGDRLYMTIHQHLGSFK